MNPRYVALFISGVSALAAYLLKPDKEQPAEEPGQLDKDNPLQQLVEPKERPEPHLVQAFTPWGDIIRVFFNEAEWSMVLDLVNLTGETLESVVATVLTDKLG